tara:strand:+ start:43 stop:231 length:189 start_codon:yes stop_codon:yes gene_type:complete
MTYGEDPMVKAMEVIKNLSSSVDLLTAMNDKLKERLAVEMEINRRISEDNFQQDYVEDRIGQ